MSGEDHQSPKEPEAHWKVDKIRKIKGGKWIFLELCFKFSEVKWQITVIDSLRKLEHY